MFCYQYERARGVNLTENRSHISDTASEQTRGVSTLSIKSAIREQTYLCLSLSPYSATTTSFSFEVLWQIMWREHVYFFYKRVHVRKFSSEGDLGLICLNSLWLSQLIDKNTSSISHYLVIWKLQLVTGKDCSLVLILNECPSLQWLSHMSMLNRFSMTKIWLAKIWLGLGIGHYSVHLYCISFWHAGIVVRDNKWCTTCYLYLQPTIHHIIIWHDYCK